MIDQMGMFEGKRGTRDDPKACGLSHYQDGLPSIELRVGTGFWCVKNKMHQTIKEMILFSLLQQGERSLITRTISRRKKEALRERQVGKGVIRLSNGSHEKDGEGSYLSP